MRFDDWLVKPELEEKKRELRRKMKKKELEDYESFKRFSKVSKGFSFMHSVLLDKIFHYILFKI